MSASQRVSRGCQTLLASLVLVVVMVCSTAAEPEKDAATIRVLAELGNPHAQFGLGEMYYSGDGVQQDYAEAFFWFRLSAERGKADAQFRVGTMYALGKGIQQDLVRAHMWFNLATSQPSGPKRDLAVKARDTTASEMTPEQSAEAERLARTWKPKRGPVDNSELE